MGVVCTRHCQCTPCGLGLTLVFTVAMAIIIFAINFGIHAVDDRIR
jgi:hypothetical protein